MTGKEAAEKDEINQDFLLAFARATLRRRTIRENCIDPGNEKVWRVIKFYNR